MADRKPNLFIVGAPRCGTTALDHYLGMHPDVFMPSYKEPHWFSADLTEEGDRHQGARRFGPFRTEEQYLWLYRDAGGRAIRGDASVLHLYSKVAAQRIARFAPRAKIIVMLREPLAFVESLHARYLFHAEEDCPSLERALELEPERRAGRCLPAGARIPSMLLYGAMARFSDQLARYREVFPGEQIKVIVFDDFRAQTEKVYRDVLAFLGLAPRVPASFAPRNPNQTVRSPRLALLARNLGFEAVKLYGDPTFPRPPVLDLPWPSRRLPVKATWLLFRAMRALNEREAPRPRLDDATRRRLMPRFRAEVERLSELLRRDLVKLWGYEGVARTG